MVSRWPSRSKAAWPWQPSLWPGCSTFLSASKFAPLGSPLAAAFARGLLATLPMLVSILVAREFQLAALAATARASGMDDSRDVPRSEASPQFAMVAALAGVGEELLFRGVLQTKLGEWTTPLIGLLLASFIFGLAHALSRSVFCFRRCRRRFPRLDGTALPRSGRPDGCPRSVRFSGARIPFAKRLNAGPRRTIRHGRTAHRRNWHHTMSEITVKHIDCAELHRASLQGPIDLIDVRTPQEFNDIRAVQARNVPLDTLDPSAIMQFRVTPPDQPLYFICAVGGRSAWACEVMMAAGHENVINVAGGTQAWYLAGFPIEQGS